MQIPDSETLLEAAQRWVAVESKTEDTEAVNAMMDLAAEACGQHGMRWDRMHGKDGYGDCLYARHKDDSGESKGVLVLAHLDTVHPKCTLAANPQRIEGDRAYGPGIFDMKASAYLAIAAHGAANAESPTDLPVRILFVSDEEVGSPFSRPLIERCAGHALHVLVVEPARNIGEVVTSRKGIIRMHLRTRGRPSHSGVCHEDGRSAILEAARHILAIEAMTDYDRGITANIGLVSGGTAANVVPEHCEASIDVRVTSEAAAQEVLEVLNGLKPHNPDVEVEVTGGLNRPPFETSEQGEALFQHAKREAADLGIDLAGIGTGGGSDGNFTAALGVPTLDGLGVVGDGAHTLEEYIEVPSLAPRCELLARLYRSLR